MTVLLFGAVEIGVECPDGYSVLVMRDAATRILLDGDLLSHKGLPKVVSALADVAGVHSDEYQAAIEYGFSLFQAVPRWSIDEQSDVVRRSDDLYDMEWNWLTNPVDEYRIWVGDRVIDGEQWRDYWDEQRARYAAIINGKVARRRAISARRAEFARVRPELVLAMLNDGQQYRCCVEGCCITSDLTVDHKIALSRGGTDHVSNLQFMCRTHNSAKGDRQELAA